MPLPRALVCDAKVAQLVKWRKVLFLSHRRSVSVSLRGRFFPRQLPVSEYGSTHRGLMSGQLNLRTFAVIVSTVVICLAHSDRRAHFSSIQRKRQRKRVGKPTSSSSRSAALGNSDARAHCSNARNVKKKGVKADMCTLCVCARSELQHGT